MDTLKGTIMALYALDKFTSKRITFHHGREFNDEFKPCFKPHQKPRILYQYSGQALIHFES